MARLKDARLRRGLTQAELGQLVGLDQSTISGLERDGARNPSWDTVCRLARALDVAPEELFPVPAPAATDDGAAA